ncbi:CoA ester lyase [Pseudomonas sp. BN414]|uniref:HpcH/HpaI aldolase/citrate lyase family protein n=1 Tax=Pseudomonas TaxID=286 RepID=UPI0015BC475F|nr:MULTISPECIES: CoA ester lyase [Pseudomonas]MDH4565601.1 CoA ester lyase [Pseudomonas sp. BN414]NWL76026.1 CoA ester lyase [Pseudomonas taiwanensis]
MAIRQLNLGRARTFLFVPANRPERIGKALATGTDVVVVDLEDAVAPGDKTAARLALLAWLNANPDERVTVRINAADTQWHEDDLEVCRHSGIAGVMLPKADSAAQVEHAHDASGKPVLCIVETGRGIEALPQVASARGCARLLFGKLDLAVELDLIPDESDPEELVFLPWRALLVLASQRAGLPAPVDGVFTVIGDDAGLARYAARARRHGFSGQLLIHPGQVTTTAAAFTPSAQDITWAQSVRGLAEAARGGVVVLDGRMIDAPVMARAERILALAVEFGL